MPNIDFLEEYAVVSKYFPTDAAKYDNYKAEQYENIAATTTFQIEERRRLQTEGTNGEKMPMKFSGTVPQLVQ